jgi:hypothetical protein
MGKTFKDQRAWEVKNDMRKRERIHEKNLPRHIVDKLTNEIENHFLENSVKGYTGESLRHRDKERAYKRSIDE